MILTSLRRLARRVIAFMAFSLAASGPVGAAWSAAMVLEVQTGGSDANNSGGFRGGSYIAAPAAPTVTPSASGGTVAAATYYVVVTATDGLGETVISGQTAVTTSGATASFTVTAVAAYTGALTWSCYVGTVSGGPYFPQGTGLTLGANRVVTATPPTTGTQPRGVDYSQATGVQLAINNTTVTATTTGANSNTLTFTGGHTPVGAEVGNTFRALTGTNINAGDYEITAVTTTTWTVAGATNLTGAGGAGSAITGNMGGCFATPGQALAFAIASNTVYIKAGTYTIGSGSANTAGNKLNPVAAMNVVGYTSTRTLRNSDTPPVLDANAASINVFAGAGNGALISNLKVTNSTAKASVTAFVTSGNSNHRRLFIDSCAVAILSASLSAHEDCYANASGSIGNNVANGGVFIRCVSINPIDHAFISSNAMAFIDCIAVGGSASSKNHFNLVGGTACVNCISVNSTSTNGIGFTVGTGSTTTNCIAYNDPTGFSTSTGLGLIQTCAAGACGTANYSVLGAYQQINCVTLGATPFTNSGSNDYSLNTTANGGALCRAAGIPGAFAGLSTTTGYRDIGAVQHADPTGGGFIPGPMMAPRAPRKTLPAQVPLKKAG